MAPLSGVRPLASTWARLRNASSIFQQVPGTFRLAWQADASAVATLCMLALLEALFPAAIAYVGKFIVDGVVVAARTGSPEARQGVLSWVMCELGLVAASQVVARFQGLTRDLLELNLSNFLNQRMLEKAITLEVRHFEDAETHDKMQNARREVSSRPLSLLLEAMTIAQSSMTLATYAVLLVRLSPWSMLLFLVASFPAFFAEARAAGERFNLNLWRASEARKLNYLEWILTRDNYVKEVKLYQLGPLVLQRYKELFQKFFDEDRALAVRRVVWGLGLGLLSVCAFYACYAFVAGEAALARITLGDMTLYLLVLRQGQSAILRTLTAVRAMYEDALFMSSLFSYFAIPTDGEAPRTPTPVSPPTGRNTIELRNVSVRYPGRDEWTLRNVNLVIRPGEKIGLVGENGAGKSTLVKLLLRLYDPTEGEILYGGVDLRDMEPQDLRRRFGAVYQDFVRYQFTASENIGLGDVSQLENKTRIEKAAREGGAHEVVSALPSGYDTLVGRWFESGQELSGGQWQKLAVSRAFMRDSEVLILDEPTSSIDAKAEHDLVQRFQQLTAERTSIIISHRLSTVRLADRIVVLNRGHIEEVGSHQELMRRNGRYAHLFQLQARGYLDEQGLPPGASSTGS